MLAARDTPERSYGKIASHLDLQPYDRVRIVTPNGGGYGDPLERDPALVLRDLEDGFLDADIARRDYGVLIRGQAVDVPATEALRGEARRARPEPLAEFDFGPEREAFEAQFPPAWQ